MLLRIFNIKFIRNSASGLFVICNSAQRCYTTGARASTALSSTMRRSPTSKSSLPLPIGLSRYIAVMVRLRQQDAAPFEIPCRGPPHTSIRESQDRARDGLLSPHRSRHTPACLTRCPQPASRTHFSPWCSWCSLRVPSGQVGGENFLLSIMPQPEERAASPPRPDGWAATTICCRRAMSSRPSRPPVRGCWPLLTQGWKRSSSSINPRRRRRLHVCATPNHHPFPVPPPASGSASATGRGMDTHPPGLADKGEFLEVVAQSSQVGPGQDDPRAIVVGEQGRDRG